MPDAAGTGLIDWSLALRLGRRLAGDGESLLDEDAVRATSDEALAMALDYTTLEPLSPVPRVEVISRDEWIESNLSELVKLLTPVEERLASELRLPGPLGTIGRKALSAAAGAEAGAVVGYARSASLASTRCPFGPTPASPACSWWEPTSPRRPRSSRSTRAVPPVGARPRADPLDSVRLGSLAALAPRRPGR